MEALQGSDPPQIGQFRVVGRLGVGGMGRVYIGETAEGARAAVKVIRDDLAGDPAFRARFQREVSAAVAVSGLFTALVLDADPDGDPPWLATQYVEGPSVRDAVRNGGQMPAEAVFNLALGLAEAVAAIHAAGLVHRDLKPANVLLSPAGPRVIDFGIARAQASTHLTGTGQMIGTPDFMAPEQVSGVDVGPAADIFALGSTLVFAALGQGPFAADNTAATLYGIVSREPDLSQLPDELVHVVRACLRKDPAERPTAQQLAAGLRTGSWVVPETAAAAPPGAPRTLFGQETVVPGALAEPTPALPRRRHRATISAAVAVAVAFAGVVSAVAYSGTAGANVAPPTAAISTGSSRVEYLNRLCSTGRLMISLGDVMLTPPPPTDLAQAKRNLVAVTRQLIGGIDAVLPTLTPLSQYAPTPAVGAGFDDVTRELNAATAAFAEAQALAAGDDPLSATAYEYSVRRFDEGTGHLTRASEIVGRITLPAEYTAVRDLAVHCR